MKAFAAFMLFDGLVLVCGLAAAVLVWIWLRSTKAAASADHPPTLEDMERALAATSALVWEAAPAPTAANEKSAGKAERASTS